MFECWRGIWTSRFLSKFAASGVLSVMVFVVGCAGPQRSRTYEVTIPEEWKQYVSVGKLRVVGPPFYGVIQCRRSMVPLVRINWSVKNLTSEKLDIKVNYWSKMIARTWRTGFGVAYTLGPHEERRIDNIYPVVSATKAVKFGIRMERLQAAGGTELFAGHKGVVTGVLPVSPPTGDGLVVRQEKNPDFVVKRRKLMYSQERGNVFVVEVRNETEQERRLVVYVAAGDPGRVDIGVTDSMGRDAGAVAECMVRLAGQGTAEVEVPYIVPEVGPRPLLVFTLFEPTREWLAADEADPMKHRVEPFCWGWYDLCGVERRGEVKLPVYLPVKERTKLTAQTKSDHFLFRYRRGSYAERNLETIISKREAAYDKLRSVLAMELPEIVTIDLYPDMEAKGLGSGTTYTACNTRSDKHICEVCSETDQCGAYHELAHIFSYHFPGYSSNKAGLVEAFAVYFEPDNVDVDKARASLRRKLKGRKLESLGAILLSESSSEELVVLVDFLLKKDGDKFKRFYVSVTRANKDEDLERTCEQIYGTDVNGLDILWRKYLNESG